jgi:RNA recognition motif-containing protein
MPLRLRGPVLAGGRSRNEQPGCRGGLVLAHASLRPDMRHTVRLMTDRDTGRLRGVGCVEMPDAREAQAAIAGLHGTTLGGRPRTINEARAREARGGPRRGPRWEATKSSEHGAPYDDGQREGRLG